MLVFVRPRCLPHSTHGGHRNLGEKLLAIMIIKLFDHAVAPRLGRRDELEIDSVEQAEADKRPHFVVDLKIVGNAHPLPGRIDSVPNTLGRL